MAARRAIEIRLEAAKASTAKLKAMLNCRDDDGRMRGLFSYHVATTGRWAGRRVMLHNLQRPEGRFGDDNFGEAEIESCIDLFDDPNAADTIRLCFGNPLPAVANCMRGLLIPAPGNKFVGGDFTGIENRTRMWVSGEEWMLEEFRKFDRGEGTDNYKLTYARGFGVPLDSVTSKQRMIGKVASLACGYNGAVGAYMGMGDNYNGFTAGDVARAARESADDETWKRISEMYPGDDQAEWRFGLDLNTWTGIRVVVEAWRDAHPHVVRFWDDLTTCAGRAVLNPKQLQITQKGKIKFAYDGHFLFMQLPSGRCLAYARPSTEEWVRQTDGKQIYRTKYWGIGKKTKRWEQRGLTASILSENAASGTARDVLTDAMLRLEDRGYPIALHVHDEAVAEVPASFGSPEEFKAILCESGKWLAGLPVAATAWQGTRFRK
jgi:DNA polymerase